MSSEHVVMGIGVALVFGSIAGMLMLDYWQKYRRWKQRHEARNRYLSSLGKIENEE